MRPKVFCFQFGGNNLTFARGEKNKNEKKKSCKFVNQKYAKFILLFQTIFKLLAFRHAGACLTLLCNTAEENLRGMKERKNERKKE